MTATEEALKLLADADERLGHAETTRRIGIYGPSVAMSYYAAFYAALAVVAYHREGPKTHRGVQKRFHFLAVKSSDFPSDIAELLEGLMAERLATDLRPREDGHMDRSRNFRRQRTSKDVRERSIRLVRSPC